MQSVTTHRAARSSGKVRKYVIIILLVIMALLAVFIWWNYYYTYSDGSRYGLLQKFSHRGNLFKTYEGEMILSSVRGSQDVPVASEKFFFSVTDENLARKLQGLQGRYVTVNYEEKKNAAFWRGDSRYVVDSVRAEQ